MFKIKHFENLLKTTEEIQIEGNKLVESNPSNGQSSDWFGSLSDWFNSLLSGAWDYMVGFYNSYGEIGVITALVGIFLVLFIIWLIVRLIEYFVRLRKRKKLRQLRAKYAAHVKPAGANINNAQSPKVMIKRKRPPSDDQWENEVRKAVANEKSIPKLKEDEAKLIDELIAGKTSYQSYLDDVENNLFTLESDIHDFVNKISTVKKPVLLNETVKLRVGLEKINIKVSTLKKLAEAYPKDDRISSLIELCEAFVKGSKGVEQGYITALNS